MGRSYPIRYTVQIIETPPPGKPRTYHTPAAWNVRSRTNVTGHGKPSDANLEKYVMVYAASLKKGGANYHLTQASGYIPYPNRAFIKDEFTGAIVAEWKAAMFQVFP